jgi:hypothetical protein
MDHPLIGFGIGCIIPAIVGDGLKDDGPAGHGNGHVDGDAVSRRQGRPRRPSLGCMTTPALR